MTIHSADFDLEHGCAGTELGKFHNGYFSDPKNAEIFPRVILKYLESQTQKNNYKDKVWKILGIGSGPALPEIMVYRALVEKRYIVKMIISDKVKEAISTQYPNHNLRTQDKISKQIFDFQDIPLESESLDIVIARESIHYQNSLEEIKNVIHEVKRVLKPGGIFVNEMHDFPNKDEANLANFERQLVGKSSQHLSGTEIRKIHADIFGKKNLKPVKNLKMTKIYSDELELVKRFNVKENKRNGIINSILLEIEKILEKNKSGNIKLLNESKNRYMRLMPLQLIIAEKNN
jgi:SAM-dependent methyltransferase